MHDLVQRSIQQTLAYFDQFNYPLTAQELFSFLWKSPGISYDEFVVVLSHGVAGVSSAGTYYFLDGRANIVAQRDVAAAVCAYKLKRARVAAEFISWIPFLEAVFVCNTVAAGVAAAESDIDVFIVAKHGYLWFVRFMTTIVLHVSGLRRHGTHIIDRMCLSFYVDTHSLALEPLTLPHDDIYFAYWLAQLIPVYDSAGIHSTLFEKNAWMHRLLPQYAAPQTVAAKKQPFKKILELGLGVGGGMWMELFFKKLQLKKIYRSSQGKNRPLSTAVVISDGVLKFHETDRREEYRKRWQEKVATVESKNTYV